MNTLCATLVVGVLAGLAGIARAGQAQAPRAIREPDLTRWFEAVEQHRPGFNDPALETIKSLSPQVFSQIRRALGDRRRGLSVELFNRLVHRGAALHMDAAMVLVDDDGRSGPLRRSPSSRVGATAVLSADGGFNGLDVTGQHWEYGRALVDLTMPLPSEDGTAKLWYVAAAAFMANRSLLAELSPHLEKGRKLFPADPDVVAYAVSVGRQRPEFLRDLGEATGGQVFENESADHLEQRFLAVLDEFRRRYVLMYTPTSSDPGWHRLEVRIKGRRGTVHARPGYLADTPGAAAK